MIEEEEDEKLIDLGRHRQHSLISPKTIIRTILIMGAIGFLFWQFFESTSGKKHQQEKPQELDSNSISVEIDTLK